MTVEARLDIDAVRRRFSALDSPLAFFDGPGGTQVPDEVIDAIAATCASRTQTSAGPYGTAARRRRWSRARGAGGRFLGCSPDETDLRGEHDDAQLRAERGPPRASWRAGDEMLVTRLDHDGNVSPWLELARDLDLVVRFADIDDECRLDLADLERQLSERTRVVAFPVASNAVGTLIDVPRVVELAHAAGALAWADAVHFAPHGPIDVAALGVDVLICSPYKFYGPHLGSPSRGGSCSSAGARTRCDPRRDAARAPLRDGHAAARAARRLRRRGRLHRLDRLGGDQSHERELGERFLSGLPESAELYGPRAMEGRVSTFAFNVTAARAREVAARLGEENIAVWHGNFYAVEVMRRLGLDPEGVVRAGIVHYNTRRRGRPAARRTGSFLDRHGTSGRGAVRVRFAPTSAEASFVGANGATTTFL